MADRKSTRTDSMEAAPILNFEVPQSLRDLETPSNRGDRLYARNVIDMDTLSPDEVDEIVKGVAFDLADKEVLCIVDQDVFDQVYSLVRGFSSLEPSAKGNLIESLCSNLSVLLPNITSLMRPIRDPGGDVPLRDHPIQSHRNAFRIYAYFLQCIIVAGETERSAPRPNGKQSRKKHIPGPWNWEFQRARIVRLIAASLEVGLGQLYGTSTPEESLLALLAQRAFAVLENPTILKDKDVKEALCSIISSCSTKYHYTMQSAASALHLLHKHEHLPLYLAEVVTHAEKKYQDGSLAVALLREIGRLNPKDYVRDNSGADNIGKFLVEIADRLPKIVATNVGILMPHFGGESYKIRSALVSVLGKLVSKDFKDADGNTSNGTTWLRNKQAMIDILLSRSRDISAYTRSRVLQTWADLCEEHALSIGLWNPVADMAAGRLEDKAAIVRKSALQLLTTLLQFNPFGPQLRTAVFEATLEMYKSQLNGMGAESVTDSVELKRSLEVAVQDATADCEEPGMSRVLEPEPELVSRNDISDSQKKKEGSDPQGESQTQNRSHTSDVGGLAQTRALVASLEAGLHFAKCIASTMPILVQLLASSISTDVEQTIQLLICARQFNVDGAEHCLRKMLPLVFSQEKGIYEAVENCFVMIYIKKSPIETASNLINLILEATIGDLASLEVLIGNLIKKSDITPTVVSSLWDFFSFNATGITPEQSRGALVALCMAAKCSPKILDCRLQNIVDIGFGRWAKEDLLLARTACITLQHLAHEDRSSLLSNNKIFNNLANLITATSLPEESWYATVEQAINAIYALHPMPEAFSATLLRKFQSSLFSRADASYDSKLGGCSAEKMPFDCSVSVFCLGKFLFLVGHIALKHFVYIESSVKKVRKQRADQERGVSSAVSEIQVIDPTEETTQPAVGAPKVDNINTELGIAASEDVKIDALQEQAEKEIVSGSPIRKFLLAACAPFIAKICKNLSLLQQFPCVRSSAVLSLCKLMVIDGNFCEKNLQLLFTIIRNAAEEHVRSNCIIALGDLAVRFPNLLEPWTEHVYAVLNDSSQSVRKNAVLVLSHLILNDMMKIKGYISEMALRLVDEDSHISNLVKLFFSELSKKGNNPIYNLLPDILSRLSSMQNLPRESFCSIMQFLISFIKKEKQMETLIEKLCNRFSGLAGQYIKKPFCTPSG